MLKSRRGRPVSIEEMTEAIAETRHSPLPSCTPVIGLDANILVRYFTQDNPVQSKKSFRGD